MKFSVLPYGKAAPSQGKRQAYLLADNWDDWFEFETTYSLVIFDRSGEKHKIGGVKIGQFGMKKDQRQPELPDNFTLLDDMFFSLGQDESYYERLNDLGDRTRDVILDALNDVAKNPELFEAALKEKVTGISLLRSVSKTTVEGQFRRITQGGATLSPYNFSYTRSSGSKSHEPITLDFRVIPDSFPPTNVQVLIGRNGVGKTHMLNAMSRALIMPDTNADDFGNFSTDNNDQQALFANLVSVSFSAFDHFDPLPEKRDRSSGIRYSYIGLKKKNELKGTYAPKNVAALAREFHQSLAACNHGPRLDRWKRALSILESDPVFKYASISNLAEQGDEDELKKEAASIFSNLSSGHKIVLLTLTRLVEAVEERTLVLIDEPEAHLHPPLLSAFTRALSDLLINRNGVAIIATHSPVILQEVPKKCVWIISRSGKKIKFDRPEAETFGENVGVLTRQVFGLEVTDSGFHKLLKIKVEDANTYEEIIELCNGEIGEEAKAIAFSMMLLKKGQH